MTDRDARPLVFLHGGLGNRHQFDHQMSYFGARHPCVTIDLPGHGDSPQPAGPLSPDGFARAVACTLEGLALTGAVIVGHSMGGQVAAELAAGWPQLVAGVVYLDAPVEGVASFTRPATEQLAEYLRSNPDSEVFRAVAASLVGSDADPAVLIRVQDEMSSMDPTFFSRVLDDVILAYDGAAADRASCPSLLIIGDIRMGTDSDRDTRPDHLERCLSLVGRYPQLSVAIAVSSGHFVMLEVPDQINAMIARFIDTLHVQ